MIRLSPPLLTHFIDMQQSSQQLIDELHERLKSLIEIGSEIEGHQKDVESKNIKLEQGSRVMMVLCC